MNMPGFSAEASLTRSVGVYKGSRMLGKAVGTNAGVVLQTRMAGPWRLPIGGGKCVIGVEDDETGTSHYEIVKCADIHYP